MSERRDPDGGAGEDLPSGWVVWNDEPGGPATWVFEPETFDAERFPAPCLPTIHLSTRTGDRRPARTPEGTWQVRLTLEPEVDLDRAGSCPTRARALDRARTFARQFATGGYDLRGAYHDPSDREAYLAALSEATGPSGEPRDA